MGIPTTFYDVGDFAFYSGKVSANNPDSVACPDGNRSSTVCCPEFRGQRCSQEFVLLPAMCGIARFPLFAWFGREACAHLLSHYYTCDISNPRPPLGCLPRHRASNFRSLEFAFWCHDDCSVVFKLDPDTIRPVEWSSLTYYHCRKHLAPKLWRAL